MDTYFKREKCSSGTWEIIRENLEISDKESLGYYELNQN
jgi:hypothetical protein